MKAESVCRYLIDLYSVIIHFLVFLCGGQSYTTTLKPLVELKVVKKVFLMESTLQSWMQVEGAASDLRGGLDGDVGSVRAVSLLPHR